MKVIFLAPHVKISGGLRIILTYANLLAFLGHDVEIIIPSRNFIKSKFDNLFQLSKPSWISNFKPRIKKVSKITRRHLNAEAVVATTIETAHVLHSFSGLRAFKFYLIQHDEGLYHGDRKRADESYAFPLEKIVVSTWLQEIMKERFNASSHLLLNPIDRDQFQPLPRTLDKESVRILMLHHTYNWKGTEEGIKIVTELKKKYPQVRLVLFGVRQTEVPLGADEYYFNLSQDRLSWLYSNADIYLCPSWDEGSGLPSMEAMACKCALVTYDNGGSRDYAFNGKTAMVAERKNQEQLKSKLEELLKDPVLRKDIAEGGYRHIMSMPTWEEQTLRLEKILKHE